VRSSRRRGFPLRWVLALLAAPGLVLLARDVLRPSKGDVAERAEEWRPAVERAAREFRVDPDLLLAMIAVESGGDPRAVSSAGARGLMQLMPPTAEEKAGQLGIEDWDAERLFDPETNVRLGAAYLRDQLRAFEGDLALALAAYNAGPGNVRAWLRREPGLSSGECLRKFGFPATKAYVSNVSGYRNLIRDREPPPRESR